jgi:hypothetical protein
MRQLRHCISPGFFSPANEAITPLYPTRQLRHCIIVQDPMFKTRQLFHCIIVQDPMFKTRQLFHCINPTLKTRKKRVSFLLQVTSYKF